MSQILIKPIITERTMMEASRGKFTFEVDLRANKNEIAAEVARVFNVHPLGVVTVIQKGRSKRSARTRRIITKSPFKKAVVLLKQGEKINLFDITEQSTN